MEQNIPEFTPQFFPKKDKKPFRCETTNCPICNVNSDNDFIDPKEKINKPKKDEVVKKIQSAKAKSVYQLAQESSIGSPVRYPYITVPMDTLALYPTIDDEERVKQMLSSSKGDVFARPCPLNPVHGFVDSRPIKTYNQFLALVDEVNTKRGNDILEILLMPKINADYNAIVTPTKITIGEGNDGATAGKRGVVINTPQPISEHIVKSSVCKQFSNKGEVPFIELVYGNTTAVPSLGLAKRAWVVQVRSGNQPEGFSSDYIPRNTVVKNVHKVTEKTDLLEWKRVVESLSEGDVIYAESMSCHGAVHGVANKIPVVTSHVPVVGEILKEGSVAPLDAARVAVLLKYLLRTKDELDYNKAIFGWKFSHTLAVNNTAGGEEVVAFSLYNLIMGGLAACLGEYRHVRGKKLKGFNKGKGRTAIFKETFDNKKRAFSIIHKVLHAFLSPRFSSGFGGKPWAECAQATIELQRAVVELINNPTEDNVNKAIVLANDLAHAQHNGGILFNKFGETSENISTLLNTSEVVTKLLELSKVEKSTINKTLLNTMNKKSPVAVKQLWEKWEDTKKKEAEKEKKAFEKAQKQQEKYMKQLLQKEEALKKLTEKYKHLSFTEKLLLPETKFQIRMLEKGIYRLQIKVLNKFIETSVSLENDNSITLPKATKKSWAGTTAKYVTAKLASIEPLKNNQCKFNLVLTGGMKIATNPFNLHFIDF